MAIKRIQKGSPDAFMQAVENKIAELGGDVTSSTKVTASYENGLSGEGQCTSEQSLQRNQDVYDWVADHEEALEDAETRFGCDLDDIDYIELIAWIYDHRQLWSDFTSRFTDIARWFIEEELGEGWDDYIESSTDIKAADGTGRWAQIDLHAEDEYKYSGNLGRSWVRVDSDAIDIWPSKEAAIENGKSSFKRNYKYGRDWDVVNIDDLDDIGSTTTIASADIKAADEFDDIEYLDALKLAVEGYVEVQGYNCTTDIIDNLYFEVQLFDDDDEDFETPIYVYVIDLDDIEPNMDEVDDDAQTIANDAVEEYESSLDETLDEKYTEIRSKSVLDSGGFTTDYTMYRDNRTGTYFFMFGDKDLYDPDPAYADWECETKEEADEWFDSYNGFDEDED